MTKQLRYMALAMLTSVIFAVSVFAQTPGEKLSGPSQTQKTQAEPAQMKSVESAQIKPPTDRFSNDAKRQPPDRPLKRKIKNYKCPARLDFPSGTTFASQPGLKFLSASANRGGCQNDLSPVGERGGFCMSCSFEANVVIKRSSGSNYKCWVSESREDEFICEYVAPLPPSQTCIFDIKLPIVNLMPYTQHLSGDKDLQTRNNIITGIRHVDLWVNADIQRGNGPRSSALFLVISATHVEAEGDKTSFAKNYAIELLDQHYDNATALDVANCLDSYGTQRPLSISPKGTIGGRGWDHDWETIENNVSQKNLIRKAECRYDTKYKNDMKRVGCRKMWFEPDVTVYLN